MKIFKALLILILFPKPGFSALPLTNLWEKAWSNGMSISQGIGFDSNDNVIVTGWVLGRGSHIIKYDSSGALVWELDIGSSNWLASDSAIDSADNIIISGSDGTVGFVTKLLPNKTEVWTRTYGVQTLYTNASVAVDSMDNCIVFDHADTGYWVVKKYDKDGTLLFSVNAGNYRYPQDVAVDSQDNIIIAGHSFVITATDMIISKFNSSGAPVWGPIIHDYGDYDYAKGVCTDKNDNIYVTGSRRISTVDYMVLRKYDKDGNFIRDIYEAVIPSRGASVAIQDDARVIVGGSRDSSTQMYMAAYDLNCTSKYWDLSYDPSTGTGIDEILSLTIDHNGNIAVACNSDFAYLTIKYKNNILLVPAAIADLVISSTGYTAVQLTWTAPGDDVNIGTASQYDIRYSDADITSANWASAVTAQLSLPITPSLAGTLEAAEVIGLNQGTTYYFAIKTEDKDGYVSYLSNVVNTTTSGTPPTPTATVTPVNIPGIPGTPAAPTELTVAIRNSSDISLNWQDNSDNEIGFKLYRNFADRNWENSAYLLFTTPPNAEDYTDKDVNLSIEYFYRVRATNTFGDSGWSNTASLDREELSSGGLDNVRLAPNPYVKNKNPSNSVWFLGLPKFVKIKIFTLSGNIVKTIVHDALTAGGSEEWDVGNLSSGIYIYILSSATEIKKGKMTIIK
jgi:hypothetical protein